MLTVEEVDAKIAELGGDAIYFKGDGEGETWEVVLKLPAMKDFDFFEANNANPATKPGAGYALVRSMVAWPDKDAIETKHGVRWRFGIKGILNEARFNQFIGLNVAASEK